VGEALQEQISTFGDIIMFLQEATPNTNGYMIAGYAVAFIVMGLYVLSMYLRNRNLHQDLTTLEELDKPDSAKH
jgi:hypothetical protein